LHCVGEENRLMTVIDSVVALDSDISIRVLEDAMALQFLSMLPYAFIG